MAKDAGAKKASRTPKAKAAAPKTAPAATKAAAPKAGAKAPAKKPAAKRDPAKGPVEKTRVAFPKDYYEPHKDEIKAPLKAHGLKWSYLGEGKGLYKKEGAVHCFTQFLDDGTHYSVWGDDKATVNAILGAWRALAGEAMWSSFTAAGETATKKEDAVKESEAVRLWKLQEPQRRPGEPDLFYNKRRDEWTAKKPAS